MGRGYSRVRFGVRNDVEDGVMANYSAVCVGGPLDGRMFKHDWHTFQYPADLPKAVFDYDPTAEVPQLETGRVGLYTYQQDDGRWHWKL